MPNTTTNGSNKLMNTSLNVMGGGAGLMNVPSTSYLDLVENRYKTSHNTTSSAHL